MGIDVIHLVWINVGVGQSNSHAARRAFAIGWWRGHVVGVATHAKACDLGMDVGTSAANSNRL